MSAPIDSNQAPKPFSSLDWISGAATAGATLLSGYAFKAASDAKTTPAMLFHVAVGVFSAKYAYDFGSAWKANTETTTKEAFFSKAFYNADNIQTDATNKVSSLFSSLSPSSTKPSLQGAVHKVIDANRKGSTI